MRDPILTQLATWVSFGILLLAGCAQGATDLEATATNVTSGIFATQTAAVPTFTPTSAATATAVSSPTPIPDALVTVPVLDGFSEPTYGAEFVHRFEQGEGLSVSGRNRDCSWLQVEAPFGEQAWVSTLLGRVELNAACETFPHGFFRPETGAVIIDHRAEGGYGKLEAENGLEEDGFVLLADLTHQPVYGVYVRLGESTTIQAVPDGEYLVFFSTGLGWDSVELRFTTDPLFMKFVNPIKFQSSFADRSGWKITLHPVPGGSGKAETIPADQFPAGGD